MYYYWVEYWVVVFGIVKVICEGNVKVIMEN